MKKKTKAAAIKLEDFLQVRSIHKYIREMQVSAKMLIKHLKDIDMGNYPNKNIYFKNKLQDTIELGDDLEDIWAPAFRRSYVSLIKEIESRTKGALNGRN